MSQRLRLRDFQFTRLPNALGLCSNDFPRMASHVNAAQERLLTAKEAGDESWYGTWAEVAFLIDPANPIVTLPREIARLEMVDVYDCPVPVRNQFYEYLQFGSGRLPKQSRMRCPCSPQMLSRNNVVTFTDLTNAPQFIAVFYTDAADIGKTVIVQGLDNNGMVVRGQLGQNRVDGEVVTLASPFSITVNKFSKILGLQKDITIGPVQIAQVDPTTSAQVVISQMDPGEETAWYRRYRLEGAPCRPCNNPTGKISVTAICKLELIPVVAPTDYCLIQSKEAIINEAQSIRYDEIDKAESKKLARYHHEQAIAMLNGQLSHYYGKNTPEVNFQPFGSAKLERVRIGMI